MPKPTVVSSMPRRASRPMRSRIDSGPVAPTLATPSEQRIRRLTAPGPVALVGHLVAEAQPLLGVGRAVGDEPRDRVADRLEVARVAQQDAAVRAVDDEPTRSPSSSSSSSRPSARLTRPSRFSRSIEPGDVDHEGEHRALAVGGVDLARLGREAQQAVAIARREGRGRAFGAQREVAAPGRRIAVVEGVDELLDPDRLGRRQMAAGAGSRARACRSRCRRRARRSRARPPRCRRTGSSPAGRKNMSPYGLVVRLGAAAGRGGRSRLRRLRFVAPRLLEPALALLGRCGWRGARRHLPGRRGGHAAADLSRGRLGDSDDGVVDRDVLRVREGRGGRWRNCFHRRGWCLRSAGGERLAGEVSPRFELRDFVCARNLPRRSGRHPLHWELLLRVVFSERLGSASASARPETRRRASDRGPAVRRPRRRPAVARLRRAGGRERCAR